MNDLNIEKNLRILVIDDNHAIHDDFRKILCPARDQNLEAAAGMLFDAAPGPRKHPLFQLDSAFQGQEGLALAQKAQQENRPYAIAFVDVRMPPGWDGVETILRLWEVCPDLQVVVCTAYSDYSWEEMSAKLGDSDRLVVLKKPFDTIEVLQLAHALTEKWRLQQEVDLRLTHLEKLVEDRTHILRETNEKLQAEIVEHRQTSEVQMRLAAAVEQAAEGIIITEPSGVIIYANPAIEKVTGYSFSELVGQNPRILKSGKHDTSFYQGMWEALLQGRAWSGRITNKKKDGALYEEEMTVSPVLDAAGKVVNYVAVKRDVTREASLEAQLRQSQKMEAVGQLAGGVAHDFNNLLTIINGNATLLLNGPRTGLQPAEAEGCARQIIRSAERAAGLTRQLLMFSRKEVMQPANMNLNETVASMTKMLQRILGEDVVLHSEFAPNLPLVYADPGMMEQVLLNLAVNSRDAMPGGGQLTIATAVQTLDEKQARTNPDAQAGRCVCLSVSDSGSGIPPEILPHIFEPFFTTKEVGKGTGLGLATVHGIVKQHHGWIDVETEAAKGTVFHICLPAVECPGIVPKEVPTADAPPRGTETVLLAEDEPDVRALIANVLEHCGYTVLQAVSGVQAMATWRQHRHQVNLLLTDLVMPSGMTGRELAARLLHEEPQLPVVYISGYSMDVRKGFSFVEGVNFLQKPFSPIKLARIVRHRLDHDDQAGCVPGAVEKVSA